MGLESEQVRNRYNRTKHAGVKEYRDTHHQEVVWTVGKDEILSTGLLNNKSFVTIAETLGLESQQVINCYNITKHAGVKEYREEKMIEQKRKREAADEEKDKKMIEKKRKREAADQEKNKKMIQKKRKIEAADEAKNKKNNKKKKTALDDFRNVLRLGIDKSDTKLIGANGKILGTNNNGNKHPNGEDIVNLFEKGLMIIPESNTSVAKAKIMLKELEATVDDGAILTGKKYPNRNDPRLTRSYFVVQDGAMFDLPTDHGLELLYQITNSHSMASTFGMARRSIRYAQII